MLGKKRSNNRNGNRQIKHKSTKDKLNFLQVKNKKTKLEIDLNESIKSISEIESVKTNNEKNHDEFEEDMASNLHKIKSKSKPNTDNFSAKRLANSDEVRTRLAKALLKKIDKKDKRKHSIDSDSILDSIEERNLLLQEKIEIENNRAKTIYWSNPSFEPYEAAYIKGHHSSITDLAIANDSSFVVTSSKDTRGIIFDINTSKKTLLPQFTSKAINCVALSSDNKRAFFGGKDKFIYAIDLLSMKLIQKIKAHNEQISGLLFDTSKEQFYSIGNDHLLKVWSNENEQSIQLETFYGHTSKINCIEHLPGEQDRILTCGMDNTINLWKVEAQSFVQFKITDLYPVDCLAAIHSDYFLSGNYNGEIDLWQTNKKKCIRKLPYSHGYEKSFSFNHSFLNNHEDYIDDNKEVNVMIGNPILTLGGVSNSDMFYSGSCDGIVNFYKFSLNEDDENEGFPSIENRKMVNISSNGCLNAIKVNKSKDMLVVGNGNDGKKGRWNVNYNAKLGITIIKLYK